MSESGEERAYPRRLHHVVPTWVGTGSYFHIRLRLSRGSFRPLTHPATGSVILSAVSNYHERGRWHALLFLIMPDHTHAILAFPFEERMSRVIGEWKHYIERSAEVDWQTNFFDHRIRDQAGLAEKYAYILRNPVVKGLCVREEDWPWVWMPPAGE
jgi:putative transposase